MNVRTLAQTLRNNVITIEAQFQNDIDAGKERTYTFLALKEDGFRVNDWAAVYTKHGEIKVVLVTKVDSTANVDINQRDFDYQWAFDRVDVSKLANRRAEDDAYHRALLDEQARTARQSALDRLGLDEDRIKQLVKDSGGR